MPHVYDTVHKLTGIDACILIYIPLRQAKRKKYATCTGIDAYYYNYTSYTSETS